MQEYNLAVSAFMNKCLAHLKFQNLTTVKISEIPVVEVFAGEVSEQLKMDYG